MAIDMDDVISPQRRKLLLKIARLYYIDDLGQKQIADHPDVRDDNGKPLKQYEISEALTEAREYKLIKFVLNDDEPEALENKIRELYPHLRHVSVVSTVSDGAELLAYLGKAAARYLLGCVRANESIGISCGRSASMVIQQIPDLVSSTPLPQGMRIYSLITLMTQEIVGVAPTALVSNLVQCFPNSIGKALQLPADSSESQKGVGHGTPMPSLRMHPAVAQWEREIQDLDHYLIGIGFSDDGQVTPGTIAHTYYSVEFNAVVHQHKLRAKLRELESVGECLYQPFTANGENLIDNPSLAPIKSMCIALPLRHLTQLAVHPEKHVIAVSGGSLKRQGVLAALRAKFCNVLVTDMDSARYVVDYSC